MFRNINSSIYFFENSLGRILSVVFDPGFGREIDSLAGSRISELLSLKVIDSVDLNFFVELLECVLDLVTSDDFWHIRHKDFGLLHPSGTKLSNGHHPADSHRGVVSHLKGERLILSQSDPTHSSKHFAKHLSSTKIMAIIQL